MKTGTLVRLLAVLTAFLLLLAGCNGSDGSGSGGMEEGAVENNATLNLAGGWQGHMVSQEGPPTVYKLALIIHQDGNKLSGAGFVVLGTTTYDGEITGEIYPDHGTVFISLNVGGGVQINFAAGIFGKTMKGKYAFIAGTVIHGEFTANKK